MPSSSLIARVMISPPSHSAVTPERPRRTIARSRVSTSGTMVSGSSHPMRSTTARNVLAWVERHGGRTRRRIRRRLHAPVPTPAPHPSSQSRAESVARLKERSRMDRLRGSQPRRPASGRLQGPPSARPDPATHRRPLVHDAARRGPAGSRSGTGTPRSPATCHQNGPSAPRASPRTASRASVWRASADGCGNDRPRRRERNTCVRCHASGTDMNCGSVAA